MGVLDSIGGIVSKFAPKKSSSGLGGGGIGNGHGMVPFDDNMIVAKPVIIAHAGQIFFNFLAMACYAGVASFQAKWKIGPSGLSGFAIFVSIAGMALSAFMLLTPLAYEKYDKFVNIARMLKEVRVSFILTGAGATFALLISFVSTISAWTQAGCKDANNDPHAEELGDAFKDGLPGWCSTKKAASIFFWFTFIFWAASVALLIRDWRSGRLNQHREPPFTRPTQQATEDDDEDGYTHIQPIRQNYDEESSNRPLSTAGGASNTNPFNDNYNAPSAIPPTSNVYNSVPAGRPSMDAYGAFSDPAPTGFGNSGYNSMPSPAGGYQSQTAAYAQQGPVSPSQGYASPVTSGRQSVPPMIPEVDLGPRVSRTMQYADPYSAVRASVAGTSPTGNAPPTYESYQGYR